MQPDRGPPPGGQDAEFTFGAAAEVDLEGYVVSEEEAAERGD